MKAARWVRQHLTWRDAAYFAAVILLAAIVGFFVARMLDLEERAEGADDAAAQRQAAVDLLAEDTRALREQVRGLGATPVAPDPGQRVDDLEPPRDGKDGEPGPPGRPPTAAEVAQAVQAYCVGQACGVPPTGAQVLAAVQAYCTEGSCTGPQGATGATGADGAIGPAGPGPTAEQIAAAVADYCATDGACDGPPGPVGATGDEGPAGRGIQAIDCIGDGHDSNWVVTFTDGTEQTVTGPCRASGPLPDLGG